MKLILIFIREIRAGAPPKTVSPSCGALAAPFAAVVGLTLGGVLCPPMRFLPPQDQPAEAMVIIAAHDKTGRAVELSAVDLKIKEGGKRTTVREVRPLRGMPMHYCLVFDSSGSQRVAFQLQQRAATMLLQKVVRAGTDRGLFVPFSERPRPGRETDNPEEISRAIASEKARGSTALYDAMASCVDEISKTSPDPGFRAMFVFSDGVDNASRLTWEKTAGTILSARIRVYTAGRKSLEDRKDARYGAKNLNGFAKMTGGKAYFPVDEKEFDEAVALIADELNSLFLVTFVPPDTKRDVHDLEVTCTKKGVSITAPEMYAGK